MGKADNKVPKKKAQRQKANPPKKPSSPKSEEEDEAEPCLVDWANSDAKRIIMEDLKANNISRDYSDKPSKLWAERYQKMKEFEHVPYRQFSTNLRSCRVQFEKYSKRSAFDEAALMHDLKIFKPRSHNDRGEPKFADSKAQKLLRKIVKRNQHHGITPAALREKHQEFQKFSLKKFRERIYQEERYQRFVNYLEFKREEKREEHREKVKNQREQLKKKKEAKKRKEAKKKKKQAAK
jgi:hypothetical protein